MDQGNQGNNGHPGAPGTPELVHSPTLPKGDEGSGFEHLAENRRMIVRRALLATTVGGIIPIPVLDEYFAGRVRAGMLMKLAERRRVDLASSSAELIGDPREGTAVRNATLTAATLLALKLAWRKFFALLALGRRAEEMATTYQLGILFDHYCAKLHVGAGIDRLQAVQLRGAMHAALSDSERAALVSAFRDGGRVLGRSAMEAPTWANERLQRAARRWAETGGQSADPLEQGADTEVEAERWIDRAVRAVEERLGRVGQTYVASLVHSFERHFREMESRRAAQAAATNTAQK
jgi:hypothetical protein